MEGWEGQKISRALTSVPGYEWASVFPSTATPLGAIKSPPKPSIQEQIYALPARGRKSTNCADSR